MPENNRFIEKLNLRRREQLEQLAHDAEAEASRESLEVAKLLAYQRVCLAGKEAARILTEAGLIPDTVGQLVVEQRLKKRLFDGFKVITQTEPKRIWECFSYTYHDKDSPHDSGKKIGFGLDETGEFFRVNGEHIYPTTNFDEVCRLWTHNDNSTIELVHTNSESIEQHLANFVVARTY